ncbi:MAG TPA: glycyl-radical enzyme activating protein [Spirochaetota bacterium]|nr:glycyl-radical enzyme activating protein [Spirochaetota bacterium]HPI90440.1 glycyl-radical enzyme activating protein [Spirochaetota bacterium]HPR49349.1 glycyl-radical enzyme activating protein [Spirochaetota bacterium]
MPETKKTTGLVLNIQRMSTDDGPGLRTTVFLKGCSLACSWCHNPESISFNRQVQWIETKCINCKTCVSACPKQAIVETGSGLSIDRSACDACGACVSECPACAMEILGTEWDAALLADEVLKDRAFFGETGGVTVSGGEPTVQAAFTAAFLMHCRERGIHTALDTCGQCGRPALETILPHVNMVLFDLKEIDPGLHRRFTGAVNDIILENIKYVAGCCADRNIGLWVRTPVIPGATARDENIAGIGAFIAANLHGAVQRWELCSFNNLCRDKYRRLDLGWEFAHEELLGRDMMEHCTEVAKKSGVDPSIVHWSGATKMELKTVENNGQGEKTSGLSREKMRCN